MNADDFIPTRRSLLSQLKNWEDQASWKEFLDVYGRLIYGVAVKTGLSDAEAQDVVQETVIIVARDLYVIKEWPVKDVARALDVSVTHVYVNKHRIAMMIKTQLKRLQREM